MQKNPLTLPWIHRLIFLLCLMPLVWLAWRWQQHDLTPNAREFVARYTGRWTMRMLLISLAITPARRITGLNPLISYRRMLGLFAFFYATLHVSSYLTFDHAFDLAAIFKDIVKRPFITVGFAALVLMLPLAITSTHAMVRRLGAQRWRALHRAVYVIAPLDVLHFWWMVKADLTEPMIYAAIVSVLLGYRLATGLGERRRIGYASSPDCHPP